MLLLNTFPTENIAGETRRGQEIRRRGGKSHKSRRKHNNTEVDILYRIGNVE